MRKEIDPDVLSGETTVMPSVKLNTVSSSSSRPAAAGKHAAAPKNYRSFHLNKPEKKVKEPKKAEPSPVSEEDIQAFKQARKKKRLIFTSAVFAVILILVFAAFFIRLSHDRKLYDNYYDRAMECYHSGDYNSALTYFRKVAQIRDSDELRMIIADCYSCEGNYSMAIEILRSMDTSHGDIAALIQENEAKRAAAEIKETFTIAGKEYDISSGILNLKACSLTNEDIELIASIYSLTELNISDNISVTDISPLALLGGLRKLDMSGCSVRDLSALSSLSALDSLNIDRCSRVADLSPLSSLASLSSVSLRWTYVSEEEITALSLAIPGCAIKSGRLPADEPFTITFSGISFGSDSEELHLSGNSLSDISALSSCTNLKILDLSMNNITDITPLVDIPGLEKLILSNNNISNIYPLMGLSTLKYVDLSNNPVSDINAVSGLENLIELYLSGTSLDSLSGLQFLNYLDTLDISCTEIQDEHLSALGSIFSLRTLNIQNCPNITGVAVDALTSNLKYCNVFHSELSYPVEFGPVTVYNTDRELDLSGLGISDLSPLRNITSPDIVDLSDNDISSIAMFEFIPSAANIRELDLSSNNITDVGPTMWLSSIEILDLSHNPIKSPSSLIILTSLKHLYIVDTDLSEGQINNICNALPNCTVHWKE